MGIRGRASRSGGFPWRACENCRHHKSSQPCTHECSMCISNPWRLAMQVCLPTHGVDHLFWTTALKYLQTIVTLLTPLAHMCPTNNPQCATLVRLLWSGAAHNTPQCPPATCNTCMHSKMLVPGALGPAMTEPAGTRPRSDRDRHLSVGHGSQRSNECT